jgi:hypothetical protein
VQSFDLFERDHPEGMTTVVDVTTISGQKFTASFLSHDHRARWLALEVMADPSDEKPERIVAVPDQAIACVEIRYERATPKRRPGFSEVD